MNRIEDYSELKERIVDWIKYYVESNGIESLVVGVSGGIDSAVTSTLCAHTGLPVYALGMPLHQKEDQETLSDDHLGWLKSYFSNVTTIKIDLTNTFETFKNDLERYATNELALANTRSRLRMVTLYQIAGQYNGIVVGTGNKVEDYGIGFYTKYGDGGVDIAPIADLYKSEVWGLGGFLNILKEIQDAKPTDGLWEDGRNDEDQIGASYVQLEEAMENRTGPAVKILDKFSKQNRHKMEPIPTFLL